MSVVVSDASPLINLARVNQFDLLATFYGQIVIPEAVYEEVVVRGEGRDGSREVKEATWIDVQVLTMSWPCVLWRLSWVGVKRQRSSWHGNLMLHF